MRVAVGDAFYRKQAALLIHIMNDCLGAVFKEHAFILACFTVHFTNGVYCVDWRNAVLCTDHEVVKTMTTSSMDNTSTIFICDMVAKDNRAFLVEYDMVVCDTFKFLTLECTKNTLVFKTKLGKKLIRKLCKADEVALFCCYFNIVKCFIQADCFISRNGPWCSCPDDKVVIFI